MPNRRSVMRKVNGVWVGTDPTCKELTHANHSLGVNGTPSESGGKRKGKRMSVAASESRVANTERDELLRIRDIDPHAELTVQQGRRVTMVRYFDPSVIKRK